MKITKKDFEVILKYLRPYKKSFWMTSVFVILQSVIMLFSPLLYGRAIDIMMSEKALTRMVLLLMIAWVVLDLLSGWFKRIKERRSGRIAYMASLDLMTQSIDHLASLPMDFHKSKKVGEIIQRFSRADNFLYNFVESGLFQVIPDMITSFLAFAVILWINVYLAMLYLVFIFAYSIVAIKKTNPIIKYQKKTNLLFEQIYGDIFDRVPNVIAIKSNSMEEAENERVLEGFTKGYHLNNTHIDLWQKANLWKDWIFATGFFVLLIAGMYLVSLNKITIGQLVILLTYINLFSLSVYSLGINYKQFREGIVTIARSEKIFAEVPENYDDPDAVVLENVSGNVEFKGVNFSYEKESVLKDINFKVKSGQMVAIVGRSGEGKSTLVDLISRYNIPQKGRVSLDGVDIQKIQLKNLRDQIAIVPQEIDLFNDSIKNNIAYSKIGASDVEIERAAKMAHCHEFIEKFPKKYAQVVGEKGVKLSTGQKQRVAIARAILRNPKILILDEATSALDSESEKYVQEALEEVMKNRTTFVIAHRLSTIRKADLILVIEDGKIVESGDHHELLAHGGVYKKLSKLQQINV